MHNVEHTCSRCVMIWLALKVLETPSMNPMPDIQSITGTGSSLESTDSDGRNMFRVRQSSEMPST